MFVPTGASGWTRVGQTVRADPDLALGARHGAAFSGALDVTTVMVAAGVTVTMTDDAEIHATGAVMIEGSLMGDCVAMAVKGVGDLTVMGAVPPGVRPTRIPGPLAGPPCTAIRCAGYWSPRELLHSRTAVSEFYKSRTPAWLAVGALLVGAAAPTAAQTEVGDVLSLEALERDLPADGFYSFVREHVTTERGTLTTMVTDLEPGGPTLGIQEEHEVLFVTYARRNHPLGGYDQAIVTIPHGAGFRVIHVQHTDVDYLDGFGSFSPPGPEPPITLLRATSAQTGSGGIVQERLFALEEAERLVPVPSAPIDWGDLLEEGEYVCCGSHTEFSRDLIEMQVFITRTGRSGITHRTTIQYELEGAFEHDAERSRFAPRFQLVPGTPTPREPAGGPTISLNQFGL